MPQLDSDSFTYSNGALASVSSGKWTKLSGAGTDFTVASNQIKGTAGFESADVITSWAGSGSDHYSQLAVVTVANDGGPSIRSDATYTFYFLDVTTSAATNVYKVVGGSFTAINNTSITWANGDTAYLEMQGNTIISKQNGTTRHNFTDSSIASGKPGFWCDAASILFDDWAAGDFSAGGPTAAELAGVFSEQNAPGLIGRVDA